MALCAGYERGEWRRDLFVDQVFNCLPSFVLPCSEQQATLSDATAVELLRTAAQRVYETDNYKARGEFGELILHGVLMQEFETQGAVSKIWFEDAKNDTAKGFDVVHVSGGADDELHLWLGEAKFYSDLGGAIRAAIESFRGHVDADYLRSEFALVAPKVPCRSARFAAEFQRGEPRLISNLLRSDLIDRHTPLDEVFSVLHLPLLVTYDSDAVKNHDAHSTDYREAVEAEAHSAWQKFGAAVSLPDVAIHVILIPLDDKAAFVERLHERLKTWQQI